MNIELRYNQDEGFADYFDTLSDARRMDAASKIANLDLDDPTGLEEAKRTLDDDLGFKLKNAHEITAEGISAIAVMLSRIAERYDTLDSRESIWESVRSMGRGIKERVFPAANLLGDLKKASVSKAKPAEVARMIVEGLKKDPFIRSQFDFRRSANAPSFEAKIQHQIEKFEEFFGDQELPLRDRKPLMRLILGLHQLGEPSAFAENDITKSHDYTSILIHPILERLGMKEGEILLVKALVASHSIRDFLHRGSSIDVVSEEIARQALSANIPPVKFFKLLIILYQCESTDIPNESMTNIDPINKSLSFNTQAAKQIEALEARISQPSMVLKSYILSIKFKVKSAGLNISEFQDVASTPEDLLMIEYIEGRINENQLLQETGIPLDSNCDLSAETLHIRSLEKVVLLLKLHTEHKKIMTSNMDDPTKQSRIRSIDEAKMMLRDGEFGSELNHGTNSLIWDGLKETSPALLSTAELKRRGIIRKTGEGDIAGGTSHADEIYAGQKPDGLGTALGYAEANNSVDGYRHPLSYTIPELSEKIRMYEDALKNMRQSPESASEGISIPILQRELVGFKTALAKKEQTDSSPDLIAPYPIIFGLKKGNLNLDRIERFYGRGLSGEVTINAPSLPLAEYLEKIYVPQANIGDAKTHLERILGQKDASRIKIYSIESLRLLGMARGGVFTDSYSHTLDDLKETQSQRFQQIETLAA